jgi:hypothetical protein
MPDYLLEETKYPAGQKASSASDQYSVKSSYYNERTSRAVYKSYQKKQPDIFKKPSSTRRTLQTNAKLTCQK